MTRFSFAILLLAYASIATTAVGQDDRVLRGMVWHEPENRTQAVGDLLEMSRSGVQAIRVDLLRDSTLYTITDTLGLLLFQDLPMKYLPARDLLDSLIAARELLADVLRRLAGHPSATAFGLSVSSDNGSRASCEYYRDLGRLARAAGRPDIQLYYVSPFLDKDRCTDEVDFVLLDLAATTQVIGEDPAARLAELGDNIGLGAVGRGVRKDPRGAGKGGLADPHSEASQAMYFERVLDPVLHPPASGPPAAFVYRWRDQQRDKIAIDPATSYVYGLVSATGSRRPAFEVVKGVFTGRRFVFAYEQGHAGAFRWSWFVVFGWFVVVLIGIAFASSPRFRQMVPRYFLAHGFFRESIAEGREVLPLVDLMLLLATATAAGVIAAAAVLSLAGTPMGAMWLRWLPRRVGNVATILVEAPWMLIVLLGSVYALLLIVYTSILSFASRLGKRMLPTQALMLIVWSRWQILLVMVAAIAITTYSELMTRGWAVWPAVALAGLGSVWCVRMTIDFRVTTRVPSYQAFLVGIIAPEIVVVAWFLITCLQNTSAVAFVARLSTGL